MVSPANHIMVDIETLGVGPNAYILSIGAATFDPMADGLTDLTFHRFIELDGQAGGVIDPSTVKFWMSQPKDAQDKVLRGPRQDLAQALGDLQVFMEAIPAIEGIWAKDPDFDLVILRNAAQRYGFNRHPLFNVRLYRSVRTMLWLDKRLGEAVKPVLPKHDALADAIDQAVQVQQVFRDLATPS